MRAIALELQSFRGFTSTKIQFDPDISVLVGVNGAGKTSVLDALAVGLSQVQAAIRTTKGRGREFTDDDISVGASQLRVRLEAEFAGAPVGWTLTHMRAGHPRGAATSEIVHLREPIEEVQKAFAKDEDIEWPFAVYYPVNRAVLDIPERIRTRHTFDRLAASGLEGSSTDFRLFFEWFREREDLENERRVRSVNRSLFGDDPHLFTDPQLEAVRNAIPRMMPGFGDLHVERAPLRMVITKGDQRLHIDQLSDGEKCLLALVGDLARRLVLANPLAPNPLDRPAVVLIDEIDLHLHPAWQRTVLPKLRAVFPACQFIVTTHSPQVLASVHSSQVRLLDNFTVVDTAPPTFGRDSNAILFEVMRTPPRPQETTEEIAAIATAIDAEDFEDARAKLEKLAAHVSERDTDYVRLRSLLAFLDGQPNGPHS